MPLNLMRLFTLDMGIFQNPMWQTAARGCFPSWCGPSAATNPADHCQARAFPLQPLHYPFFNLPVAFAGVGVKDVPGAGPPAPLLHLIRPELHIIYQGCPAVGLVTSNHQLARLAILVLDVKFLQTVRCIERESASNQYDKPVKGGVYVCMEEHEARQAALLKLCQSAGACGVNCGCKDDSQCILV